MLLLVALMMATMQAMAADVDLAAAQSKAQQFLMGQSSKRGFNATTPNVKSVHQELNSSNASKTAYYVINTDMGWHGGREDCGED